MLNLKAIHAKSESIKYDEFSDEGRAYHAYRRIMTLKTLNLYKNATIKMSVIR